MSDFNFPKFKDLLKENIRRRAEADNNDVSEETYTYATKPGDHGVFSKHPHRKEKAIGAIKVLMRDKLSAHEAKEKLAAHLPDPKVMGHIDDFHKLDPNVDVRPVIKKRLRELKVRGF